MVSLNETAEKTKRFFNEIKMAFRRESIVVVICYLNNNMHHLAGRMSWQCQLRAAVHREITNLCDTEGKKVQGMHACMCV